MMGWKICPLWVILIPGKKIIVGSICFMGVQLNIKSILNFYPNKFWKCSSSQLYSTKQTWSILLTYTIKLPNFKQFVLKGHCTWSVLGLKSSKSHKKLPKNLRLKLKKLCRGVLGFRRTFMVNSNLKVRGHRTNSEWVSQWQGK